MLACKFARDRGAGVSRFLGYDLGAFGGGGYVLSLNTCKVLGEKGLALAPGLVVGVELGDVGV